MKKRVQRNGFFMFLMVLTIVVFPGVFFRRDRARYLDEMGEVFGIAFILLGQLLRVSARGYKAAYSRSGKGLLQSGPYAVSRNPMYLGILFIGLGIILVLFNFWVSVLFLAFFMFRYLKLIDTEERKLLSKFPQEYAVYRSRVPRILPSLVTLAEVDMSRYLPLRPEWVRKEIISIAAVLLVTLAFESWEDIRRVGLKAYGGEAMVILVTIGLFVGLTMYLTHKTANLSHHEAG